MKKALLLISILFLFHGAFCQQIKTPFFGHVKDVGYHQQSTSKTAFGTKVTSVDSTFFILRPVTGVAYSFPNNQAMGFAGISYGNTTYNYETKSTYVNYSFDVVYGLGATTTPGIKETSASSFGFGIFALNRAVGILLLWNSQKNAGDTEPQKIKPVIALSVGINL